MVERHQTFKASTFISPVYWPTWIGLSTIWLLSRLPFNWQLKLGGALGSALYYAMPSRRRICSRNISFAFPNLAENERLALTREVFKNIGFSVAEMATLWFQPMSKLHHRFTLQGREILESALASERGVILLQAHFSTLEFCGAWMATQIPNVSAVYDEPKNPLYAALLRNRRQRYIKHTIDNRDIRRMVKQLKSGDLVWYSPDQSVSRKYGGIESSFFGRNVLTTPGTSRMAKLTGAIVLPYLPVREAKTGHYTLTVYPPLDGFPTDDPSTDTETINRLFETHIRQYPEQYFWVHKRFKRVSKDLPDPYQ